MILIPALIITGLISWIVVLLRRNKRLQNIHACLSEMHERMKERCDRAENLLVTAETKLEALGIRQ